MRWSRYYLFTTREVPSDAEVVSHQLMVRAGMIRKVAAGIYTSLPLGWRSIQKLIGIVRRELDAAGAVELAMPIVQPAELWQESGRWTKYGKELLRLHDRHDRDFCFGPTHEEVITDTVRRDVKSYRQLPVNLYQVQTKFRDEIRPRFGLMRGREFLMKDGYSFHVDTASLDATYQEMLAAYRRIFESCGLDFNVVEADTGSIGGESSHELMVLADTGESVVVRCPACAYAANVEKAETRPLAPPARGEGEAAAGGGAGERREVPTPGVTSVPDVARFLGLAPDRIVKTLLYDTGQGLVAAVVRGDREVNEVKLANLLGVEHLALAGEDAVRAATGAPPGFAGPVGLAPGVRLVVDRSAADLVGFVCGANRADAHFCDVDWRRDVAADLETGDLLLVGAGDACPRCEGTLELFRGIETGHVFKLGTEYSRAMGCTYTDDAGGEHPMVMGCYGLGIGRTVAAAIEQNHDADGIVWPRPLAPFEVLLAALNPDDPEVRRAAERLYGELRERGADVLYDDRDERPGVKFKDADLVGFPVRLVVGARSLAEGNVEVSLRRDREKRPVPVGEAVGRVLELLENA